MSGIQLADKHKSTWSTKNITKGIVSKTASGGVILGNGDFKALLGQVNQRKERSIKFIFTKNDFWRLQQGYGNTMPKTAGELVITSPQMVRLESTATQSLADGRTTMKVMEGDVSFELEAILFARDNVLMVTLCNASKPLDVNAALKPIADKTADCAEGAASGVHWITKQYTRDVDIPTAVAMGMKISTADGKNTFKLEPGKSVQILCSIASRFRYKDEKKQALALLKSIDVPALKQRHTAWWTQYWDKSWVSIPSLPAIEKHYYQSLYGMGAASRDPDFPPAIFGWETTDYSGWHGDYHMNYNHFAPFYALYAANRMAQGDPQDMPMIDFMDRARDYAKVVHGKKGLLIPVGIGPKGMDSTLLLDASNRHYKRATSSEPYKGTQKILIFGQKSNSAYAAINFIQRWRTTQDLKYAKDRGYPFVLGVADYWEDYLVFENGRYVIYKDSIHEGSGEDINPILSLGLVPNVFKAALEMSTALKVDLDRHEKWNHILKHMSGWSFQEMKGKKIFRYSEKGTAWWRNNTLGIQHIYPSNAITLNSDPKLLKIAQDTAIIRNAWSDHNGSNSFYPACVRVGLDPNLILKNLRGYAQHTRPNGMQDHNPHGIENFSTTPNTINMMMCMSVGYVIRIFPVWPKDKDAKFKNIRCWGAFLVSGEQKNGMVQPIEILSEKGKDCTIVNPWSGKEVRVTRNGKKAETVKGDRFTLKTKAGETITLVPSK